LRHPQVNDQIARAGGDPATASIQQIANATRDVRNASLIYDYDEAAALHRRFPLVYPDPGPPPYHITDDGRVVFGADPNNI
jgi:hypothetical protein